MDNTKFNTEVAKMKSLMERLQKPHTNYEAMLNEERLINETKVKPEDRNVYNDLNQILYDKNWFGANGHKFANHFVSLGYVINASTPASIYPTPENEEELDNIISNNEGTEWAEKLSGYRNDAKWNNIMSGKGKSKSFRGGGLSIIAIVPYLIQWQTGEHYNKWYNERKKGEEELAKKYGVDYSETEANTEQNKMQNQHFNYGGKYKNGEQPIFGGRYGDSKNGDIARYNDGQEKLALKHIKHLGSGNDSIKKMKTCYYYLNSNGEYVEIPSDIYSFLVFKLGGKKVAQKVKAELDAKEEESMTAAEQYARKLSEYRAETSKMIQQFVTRQIGYLVGTVEDDAGNKEPIMYINPNVDGSEISKNPFSVDKDALYKVLYKKCMDDKEEVIEANS